MTLSGILWIVGMLFVFTGEQVLGTGVSRWIADGIGILLVIGGTALRARGLSAPDPSLRRGHLLALIFSAVSASALIFHFLGTDEVTALFGFDDQGLIRWQGVFATLTAVVLVVGAVPMFFLDLVLSGNPVVLPRDAARRAMVSGLSASLAICLVFPVNYLASNLDDYQVETSYFRTAKAGEATKAMVQGLTEPVTVHLFFPSGNDVLEEIKGYTKELQAAAPAGLISVEVHDQATSIGLAEELKLQDNGWVVLQKAGAEGEEPKVAKFKMREEIKRAKRDLKRFDSLFQKNLLKVTRGTRLAYFVTGHGEASHRTKDNDWRKLSKFRKELKEQSYKMEDVGLAEGLSEKVPADAEVLFLASPGKPLLPEETQAITTWLEEQGGELVVMVDSQSDDMSGLLGWLGLERIPGPVADPKKRIRGQSPYLVVVDRYGTHPVVSALSRRRQPLIFPGPVGLREVDGGKGKRTVLVRTYGTAFSDTNANGRMDGDESAKVLNLAYAVEGGEGDKAWRVVVIGNQGFVSDQAYTLGWRMGGDLVVDALRWLEGEEDTVGETESEEDVKIDHSPDGQSWYFWGTIFAVPLLVLGAAITRFLLRRRMA